MVRTVCDGELGTVLGEGVWGVVVAEGVTGTLK